MNVRRICLLITSGVGFFVGGCHYEYRYEIHVVVRNATNGEPIEGVEIALNRSGNPDAEHMDRKWGEMTSRTGQVSKKVAVSDGEVGHERTWHLKLRRDGYLGVIVEIAPESPPSGFDGTVPIFVVCYLRQEG